MMAVKQGHLQALYAGGDDPWGFRTSAYEQAKYQATRAALAQSAYASALELGCGNGEFARHIAPLCANYTGVDAVASVLDAARCAVPGGRFVQAFLPCKLPGGPHDLILLSEVLYFLDLPGIAALGGQIARRWPAAEVVTVNWLGPSGNPLQGATSLIAFAKALRPAFTTNLVSRTPDYRIDRFGAP